MRHHPAELLVYAIVTGIAFGVTLNVSAFAGDNQAPLPPVSPMPEPAGWLCRRLLASLHPGALRSSIKVVLTRRNCRRGRRPIFCRRGRRIRCCKPALHIQMLQTGTANTMLQTGTAGTLIQSGTASSMIRAGIDKDAGPVNILILR